MQNQTGTKFEFLLTLEGNIIIQRYFFVKNYNTEAKSSMDLFHSITDICELIKSDLKLKSFNYSYENQHYFHNLDDVGNEEQNSKEQFLLEIKLEDNIFIQRIFPAYVYHPKARYSVDIRPKVREILTDLTNVLSSKELDLTFLNYNLTT